MSPANQHPIHDPGTRRRLTIADFAFPADRVAVSVDRARIHAGNLLRRDRRIEQRLHSLDPPWTIIGLDRRQIDHRPREMVERITAALGSA